MSDVSNPSIKATGKYSFMVLYMGFFFIPACWLLALPVDRTVPRDVAGIGFFYGVTFLLYGLYKVFSYGMKNDMVDTEAPGFSLFVVFARFVDKLR
jgi:hypothetical protein